VIVAVGTVNVVEVARDKVVCMIPVRHHLMAAACPMLVRRVVRGATMRCRAGVGIRARDLEHVLVDVALVSVMHMPIVQVVDMPGVLHLRVSTVCAVHMIVPLMNRMCHDLSVTSTHVRYKKSATGLQVGLRVSWLRVS
jgi:hypothetical protein